MITENIIDSEFKPNLNHRESIVNQKFSSPQLSRMSTKTVSFLSKGNQKLSMVNPILSPYKEQ
jgi:hypothetical protein